jgi:hypothetical protein
LFFVNSQEFFLNNTFPRINMQFKTTLSLLFGAVMATGVIASPLPAHEACSTTSSDLATRGNSVSFNNWGGFSSLNGFDDFFGADNFGGFRNDKTVIEKEKVVCRSERIEIVQRNLIVLQEIAKRMIVETICEVEVQTIVLEQFQSGFNGFSNDLSRKNGRFPGYDRDIASRGVQLFNSDGSLSNKDLGFSGKDVGKNFVTVGGGNWDNNKSPASVQSAFKAADGARLASLQDVFPGA